MIASVGGTTSVAIFRGSWRAIEHVPNNYDLAFLERLQHAFLQTLSGEGFAASIDDCVNQLTAGFAFAIDGEEG